ASIKPVHSLVAGVMDGIGTPLLILGGAGSPHSYSLKPSQAAEIQDADLIFWVGPELESFLEDPLQTIGAGATIVELLEAPGIARLALREGGLFEAHEHDGGHEDHDKTGEDGHHEEIDAHIWLDPQNAAAMVSRIEAALAAADPANAQRYAANAATLRARLDALITEIDQTIRPVRGKSFIVFHDGYQYFEERFGVAAAGSITVNPEIMPGADRVRQIRDRIRQIGSPCVFAEPQFTPKLIDVVTEGSGARIGVFDPLGAEVAEGPELYFTLIRGMAKSLRDCLSEAG
ncbi:MAG: zinc ABC transporter substrate-binding protein, partial [Hyphomicrobiales bacterium]|nr:zinc ABC transporter substrate-binding protein [Hyphomicrobiales bacterium]